MATCPNAHITLYQLGEKMYKADLKKTTGDKTAIVNKIIDLYGKRAKYFPANTKKGLYGAKAAQLLFDNKMGTAQSQYDAFNKAWEDKGSIKSAKSIYTRFKLAVGLYKAGNLELQEIFDLYDETQAKLLDAKLQKLKDKEDAGQTLSKKEARYKKNYNINLKAFATFASSTDGVLGELGNCSNLVPLYNGQFEANKNDIDWINKAASRLSEKECTDDPVFKKLVVQLDALKPTADSAYYLMILSAKSGDKASEAKYFDLALQRMEDPSKRAKLYFKKAEGLRKAGSYGQARTFYNKALADNPSMGKCYLRIGTMYAASANNCGTTAFDKQATYWLAANVVERAGRVDPRLAGTARATAKSWRAKAPSKTQIFNTDKKSVKLNCWIGRTVKVPTI